MPTLPEYQDLLGQRIGIKKANAGPNNEQHVGSIRFVGKLINNPKAGDNIWIGVEWDNDAAEGGPGKHQGTVDGVKYFDCQFHDHTEEYKQGLSKVASFVRHGKCTIGGIDFM